MEPQPAALVTMASNVVEKESCEVLAGEIAGGVAHSGVGGEGAAAELRCGHDDFAAVGGEHTDGGFVEVREGDLGDAAGEEGHAGASRADWRGMCGRAALKKKESSMRGRRLFAVGEAEKF